ncbi:MAG: tetratricopeptide repeat protein, partial [Terriglobales bacterium]
MNLLPILIPIGKQYALTTPNSIEDVVAELTAQIAVGHKGEQSRRPFAGSVDSAGFRLRKNEKGMMKLCHPEFRGKFVRADHGTEITATMVPTMSMNILVDGAANTMIGATLGVVVACSMMPDAVAVSYSFVLMAIIPALFLIWGAHYSIKAAKGDSAEVIDGLQKAVGAAVVTTKEPLSSVNKALLQNTAQLLISAVLFVLVAFYVHSLVWQLWCHGRYREVEIVTKPIAELTDTLLGPTSGAAIDCRYYLAETQRAQGKLAPARDSYDKVIEALEKAHPERHAFLGDNRFGLGRVLDEMGYHSDAEAAYKKA